MFQVRDVVELQSDSPQMTIKHINSDKISVVWFDSKNDPHRDTYTDKTLKKIS